MKNPPTFYLTILEVRSAKSVTGLKGSRQPGCVPLGVLRGNLVPHLFQLIEAAIFLNSR